MCSSIRNRSDDVRRSAYQATLHAQLESTASELRTLMFFDPVLTFQFIALQGFAIHVFVVT